MLVYNILPSGNLPCLLKMAIEIVDLPTKNGDFQQLCKRLPEGMPCERAMVRREGKNEAGFMSF